MNTIPRLHPGARGLELAPKVCHPILMGKPNATVLIGCGEAAATKSIKLLLADSFKVTEATSFDEVVREASTGGFDVVIVYGNCLSAPVLTSGGLLKNITLAIRTIKTARPVPILALTSTPEWRGALLEAGADSCVTTPFNVTEFRQAVDECLHHSDESAARQA